MIEKNFVITKKQKENLANLMKTMMNLALGLGDIKIMDVSGPYFNEQDGSYLVILKYELLNK